MIKALNIASAGLLQAERRANDVAQDILKNTSRTASSFSDAADTAQTAAINSEEANTVNGVLAGRPATAPAGSDFGNLIQQFADLRAETAAFKANAAVFSRIDDTLGTLLDDES